MRVLISAFACQPDRGSEPGVGWEWAKALAEISDHDVTVLTQAANREAIEAYVARHGDPGVRFRYVALQNRFRRLGSPGHYLFYYLWQLRALIALLRSGEWRGYGLVHHLTYGGIRSWSLLWLLPRPFGFGPVGGAESAPFRLYRSLGASAARQELVRGAFNGLSRIDPILAMMQLRARLVLVRTRETKRVLLFAGRRAGIVNDVAASDGPEGSGPGTRPPPQAGSLRILFAGRLLYWKGVAYLIEALKRLDVENAGIRVDIAGDGPMRERIAEAAKVLRHIDFRLHGRIPQPDLFALYREADAFVFPSLHDSGGTAVIEALSFGLPVICFDLGGPPLLVGDGGVIVPTRGADMARAADALAAAIGTLRDDPGHRLRLSHAASARAAELTWRNTVRTAFHSVLPLRAA